MDIQLDALHGILVMVCGALGFLWIRANKKSGSQTAVPASEKTNAAPNVVLKQTAPESALQLLAALQQEARFIDFTREDMNQFSDAEVGAVARVLHDGARRVLNDYFVLEPVRNEAEESRVTVSEGTDKSEIRLTGNVVGVMPFTGTLIHKGWKATETKLPKLASGHNVHIIAPAEVEL